MTIKTALDRGRQAAPQLYELLRQKIISLELAPGTLVSRAELAVQFEVSQTPVREALLKLAEEKLVDVFPQASTRVSLIDVAFARETHFLRRSLELELVRELAISHEPELIEELRALLRKQETLRDAKNLAGFTEADLAFHRALYLAAGKEPLWYLVRSRSGHHDRLRQLHLPVVGKLDRIINDHGRIIDAIDRHDPEGAQQALREHLSGTLEYVAQIQADYPQLFKAV
ncbi:MAG: GntR family transcriptional regulator [Pusillimonas sp.]